MTGGELQGWYRDPFGLHEKRYFSAGRPTRLVRDGPIDSYDEPPSSTYEMPADATGEQDFTPSGYIAMTPGQALPGDAPRLPAAAEWSPWSWYGRASIVVVLVATLAILAVMLFGSGQPP